VTLVGLSVLGVACASIIIPVMPEMIEAVEDNYSVTNSLALHSTISGIFISFQGVGETLGPIMGSMLS